VWTDSASIFTRLGLNDGLVAFGNSLGEVKLLNAADGSLVWTTQTGASLFSRPVITGKAVIVPSADRQIRFLDRRDGHQLSSQPSQGPYVADGLLDGDNLYQGGYKKFEMWDVNTGQQRWLFDSIGNYCQASPTLAGDKLLFGAWDTYLYCLSRDNGQMLWKWNNGKTANMLGPGNVVPVVSGDKVIIVAPDRYMTAIDLNTGATLWRDNSHRYRESLGVSQDTTTAYAKTMDGELVAVDLTTPEFSEKWVIDMGLGYEHAPCIVAEKDGIVYTGSRRGVLTAIYPASPTIVGQVTLGSSEINGIDVDPLTGDIWVSLIEGTVWRLSRH
jgi:outer membrane protein assembly factor BamB